MKKQLATVDITIKVPFDSYGTRKLNDKVREFIRQQIENTIEENCAFVNIYLDELGTQDCSKRTNFIVKVRKVK